MIHLHHDGLSRPLEGASWRFLSLGAGVQSTTLYLMAERGEVGPRPDAAFFADTEDEPWWVYEHLAWLESIGTIPIHRIGIGSLGDNLIKGHNSTGQRHVSIPAFVENERGGTGVVRRQCTREYKLDPILQETRRMMGLRPRQRGPKHPVVEVWIGISTDEVHRVSVARKAYLHNRHPLIEARMSRADCERWLAERQYPIPKKSACSYCPYRRNSEWLDMKINAPADFARAVEIDQAIRHGNPGKGLKSTVQAVHRSLRPLEEIDFAAPETADFLPGFGGDCMGLCGV